MMTMLNVWHWLQLNWTWFLRDWFIVHTILLLVLFYIVEYKGWRLLPFMLYGKQLDVLKLIGGIVDVSYNWIWGTAEFLWPPQLIHAPREITFSQRLQQYKLKTRWWQFWHRWLATAICAFLEYFLPGHCKK